MAPQSRYASPAPAFTPAIFGRCEICHIPLSSSRARNMFDYICNGLINPRPEEQGDRVPRRGEWPERVAVAQDLHAELRGGRPGWGRLDVNEITRRYDSAELVAGLR